MKKILFFLSVLLVLSGCGPAQSVPTAIPLPIATETPTPEPAISSSVINAGNASQLKQIAALELPESMLNTLVFSPDSRTLVSGDASGEVNLWERGTWQKNAFLAPQSDFKRDADEKDPFYGTLALSPSGKIIVTINSAGEVKGQDWDGKEQFTIPLGDPVYSTAISPDSKYLAAGGLSKKLIIVDLETNQQVADLSNDYEYISNLVFSPDGKSLLASYERPGNVMKTWDTATWKEIETFSHTTERFDYHDILFTPDGKSLVIASTRNDIEFFDIESQQVVQKLQGHPRAPYQIAFSPDGSLLASASDDMTLRLWDLKTGKAVLVLRNQHEVGTVAFSPDGTLLAFGVWNEGIQVWALNEVLPPAPAASASGLIAFLSDRDGEPAIYVMNADGSNQRRLAGGKPKDTCLRPVWSPDGLQIAFFSRRDGNVEICVMDAAGGNLQRLTEQVGDDSFPSWSPDGSQIIFSSVRDGNDEIYVMNSDGSNTHPLTDNGAQNWSPVWRPLP